MLLRGKKFECEGRRTKDEGRSSLVHHPSSIIPRMLLLFSVLCSLPSVCHAQSISSAELINNAKQYDGKEVVYAGEVVGDVMVRGGYAWVNLLNESMAIGIWVKKDLTQEILNAGKYRVQGDEVEVEGIFHRACLEHGGDLDIHANSLRKVISGSRAAEKIDFNEIKLILGLSIVLGAVLLLKRGKA